LADENFVPEIVMKSSECMASLCEWLINITKYYDIIVSLAPKKAAVAEVQATLA
jgi:dynein heavy chain